MTRFRHRLAAATIALVLPSAFAGPARATGAATSASAAEQLANEAYEQHAAGKYAEAIATYLRAYEISKAGAILFNVATIYDRKLHERGLAEDYYRRYLGAADVDPDLVKKATERLTALKREDEANTGAATKSAMPAVTPLPAAPVAPPPMSTSAPPPTLSPSITPSTPPSSPMAPASTPGRPLRTAGIVVGAVGLAGVGASMILGLIAKGKNDEANTICNGAVCSSDRGVSLAKDAGTFATASTVAFVAGLALVGGGVGMFVFAPKDSSSTSSPVARVTVAPQVGATQVGLGVGGSF